MGASLIIERPSNPITLPEWQQVVSEVEGIRFSEESASATNPKTGEEITLKKLEGDAELYDDESGAWHPAIMWRERRGTASFNSGIVGRALFGDLEDPIWQCVSSVARRLSAQISGEGGEVYNLDTAKPE